jgi:hypothetical protein
MEINVERLIPAITAELAEKIKQRAEEALTYQVQEQIRKAVTAFIEAEILPAVQVELETHRATLTAAIITGLVGAAKAAGDAITTQVAARMSGHEGGKVIAAVFDAIRPSRF